MLEENKEKLYGWLHPDDMRAYRLKHKSMVKKDKLTTLSEAIKKGVKKDDYLVLGGFGAVRNPMAAVYEIIRQDIKDLTLGGKASQNDANVLIASGNITQIEVAYAFADEIRGLSRPARAAVESGRLKVLSEMTNAGFQWRFTAAMKGLSFYPTRTSLGTDTLHYSGSKTITDPFTNEPIELLPACHPDVAIIHVHRADKYGNCQIDGNVMIDVEIAHAAKHVIVTAEEIVHEEVISNDPALTKIPFFVVDSLVEVPFGSHPNQVPGLYSFDEDQWQIWLDASLEDDDITDYLNTYVHETNDHYDYLEKIGGVKVLHELKKIEKGLSPYPKVARRG